MPIIVLHTEIKAVYQVILDDEKPPISNLRNSVRLLLNRVVVSRFWSDATEL
ncbi:hypothetical protein BH23BAC1_BH23BAC1_36750 [soil metagenome]